MLDNYTLERAFIFVSNAVGVVKEGCLPLHTRGNVEDPEVLILLEEDGNAMLLGFDDTEGKLV